MKIKLKNKKGDISITILVIGVVAVCAFALLSFFSASFSVREKFTGIEEMNILNSQINEYYFYKEKGMSENEISSILDIDNGKISIEKNRRKFWLIGKEEFLFSVEYSLK